MKTRQNEEPCRNAMSYDVLWLPVSSRGSGGEGGGSERDGAHGCLFPVVAQKPHVVRVTGNLSNAVISITWRWLVRGVAGGHGSRVSCGPGVWVLGLEAAQEWCRSVGKIVLGLGSWVDRECVASVQCGDDDRNVEDGEREGCRCRGWGEGGVAGG